MNAMQKSEKDRLAEEVVDRWVSFQMALYNKRKYPAGEFNAFATSVRRYVARIGRIFDGDKAIAAHRSYPFGTVVRVTCLANRRSVNVVIIDRGPYGKNRREGAIIDLSRSAAEKLGIISRGQARVKLEVLHWGKSIE